MIIRQHVRSHILSQHEKEKPFKCATCSANFTLKHNLNQHIKRVHEKINKNQCTICDLSFDKRDDLKLHMKQDHPENNSDIVIPRKRTCWKDPDYKDMDEMKISKIVTEKIEPNFGTQKDAMKVTFLKKLVEIITSSCIYLI